MPELTGSVPVCLKTQPHPCRPRPPCPTQGCPEDELSADALQHGYQHSEAQALGFDAKRELQLTLTDQPPGFYSPASIAYWRKVGWPRGQQPLPHHAAGQTGCGAVLFGQRRIALRSLHLIIPEHVALPPRARACAGMLSPALSCQQCSAPRVCPHIMAHIKAAYSPVPPCRLCVSSCRAPLATWPPSARPMCSLTPRWVLAALLRPARRPPQRRASRSSPAAALLLARWPRPGRGSSWRRRARRRCACWAGAPAARLARSPTASRGPAACLSCWLSWHLPCRARCGSCASSA